MATLLSVQNHNFTAAAWGTVDATALLVSNSNNAGLTSTYALSSTFTPGAITIDGIAVWVTSRNAAPSGTVSIALDLATVTVVGTEVTIDVADIPAAGNCWVLFKFAAPVLLAAATAYSVKAKTSAASGQVTLYRNATTTNWSRLLRTTTLAAPGASDSLYIMGEKTGSGTGNSSTVTVDNTATTIFGLVDVSSGGFLIYGTAASTNYLLKMAGNLNIRSGGEVNIGTTSARIPATSTADLFFSNSTNVDFGVEMAGSGIFRTGGDHSAVPWALLAADASVGATSLTTDQATGWKNGNVIAIASTTRTASQCESKALTADASGTTLTISALTNAHGGNAASLVQAELANLSRNVTIHGTSTSLQSYVNTSAACVCDFNDTEFYQLGSGTGSKRGVDVSTTTGSFSASYCSFHDFIVSGSIGLNSTTSSMANVTIANCVLYNCAFSLVLFGTATSATSNSLTDVVGIRTADSVAFQLTYLMTLTNLRAAGSQNGIGFQIQTTAATPSINGLVAHSNAGQGIQLRAVTPSSPTTFSNLISWRNNSEGILLDQAMGNIAIDTFTVFGNNSINIHHNASQTALTLVNGTIRAGVTLVAATGVQLASTQAQLQYVNCVFGGGGETHSSGDLLVNNGNSVQNVLLDNCTLNSPTQVGSQTNLVNMSRPLSKIAANFLGATQNHKTWLGVGTWSYDAAIFVVSPSLRMTPTSASIKLQSPTFYAGATSGQSVTASVAVRTSLIASGDSATYNGNAPRLIARRNYGAGITSDTVLATATGASSGAFETISGATAAVGANCALEFYIDCDGTTGWVNIDSFSLIAA